MNAIGLPDVLSHTLDKGYQVWNKGYVVSVSKQ